MQRYLLVIFLFSQMFGFSVYAAEFKGSHPKADNIEIKADRLDVYNDRSESIFSGNVEAVREDIKIYCEKLHLFFDSKTHTVSKLIAEKDVRIFWEDKKAVCSEATYLLVEKKIIMVGDVVITRGDERLSAQRVTIDMKANHQTVEGKKGSRVDIKVQTEKETGILEWNQ